jgi:ATP-dependent helicase HrpA
MGGTDPLAPTREIEARLAEVLRADEPAIQELLQRATRRLARGQPADRLLDQARERCDAAIRRAEAFRATLPETRYAGDLPIHAERDRIVTAIRDHPVLVLCGETGSGKTTQLPKLCLDAGRGRRGLIGHTQPRRIAARSVAGRIAEELGSELGAAVGYKVRFGDQTGSDTHIKLMTDGILLAELRQDRELLAYDTLIIDEAHERSLNIDFLLGYLKQLLPQRPDLRIIITSATLDPERLARFFDDAPIIEVPGRAWPVEVRYRPLAEPEASAAPSPSKGASAAAAGSERPSTGPEGTQSRPGEAPERDLVDGISIAVGECCRAGAGDILVFLPGEREIRDAATRLRREQPAHTEILPLYARLSAAEQSRVFRPHPGRRIVLATNVAETALTVPGIRFVIDTGLARLSRYSWRSRVQRLSLEPIAQASCNQRAGRCGRLGPGICIRLFSEEDFQLRPEHTDPEILRSNLAAVILQMAALGLGDPRHFPFVDPPDPRLIRDGYRLLEELHAVDAKGRITAQGRQLAQLPVDPRFAAMIVAGGERGVLTEAMTVAAFLALQDPRERPAEHAQAADQAHREFRVEGSDFLGMLKLWDDWHRTREELGSSALKRWCRDHFLSFLRMREWQELRAQLATLARGQGLHRNELPADPENLHKALLAGLVSHVGRKTERGDYLGTRNRRFQIHPGSGQAKRRPEWIMSAEIAETTRVYAREVAAIKPEWILEVTPHLLKHDVHEPHFQARDGRIGAWDRITLYGLVVAPRAPVNFARHDPQEARRLFIQHGLVEGRLRSRSRGLAANLATVAEIAELEARGRRRDLLAEEDRLRAFYDQRLPGHVVDGPGFEAWVRKAEKADPDLLRIDRAALMQEPEAALPEGAYPDALAVQGIRLPLSYRFEPGQEDDGVTVTVPIAALNGLPDWLGDWLVPGLLEERVVGLLRSLPKGLRRHFVPAPDFARAALDRMPEREGPLLPALTNALETITGTRVPPEAWRPESLEPHLTMRFRILDPDGAEIVTGRDLPRLKARLEASAGAHFDQTRPDDIAREGITSLGFRRAAGVRRIRPPGRAASGLPRPGRCRGQRVPAAGAGCRQCPTAAARRTAAPVPARGAAYRARPAPAAAGHRARLPALCGAGDLRGPARPDPRGGRGPGLPAGDALAPRCRRLRGPARGGPAPADPDRDGTGAAGRPHPGQLAPAAPAAGRRPAAVVDRGGARHPRPAGSPGAGGLPAPHTARGAARTAPLPAGDHPAPAATGADPGQGPAPARRHRTHVGRGQAPARRPPGGSRSAAFPLPRGGAARVGLRPGTRHPGQGVHPAPVPRPRRAAQIEAPVNHGVRELAPAVTTAQPHRHSRAGASSRTP